jgi:hypothetical protein
MNSIDRLFPFLEGIELLGMKTTRAYEEVKAGRLAVVKNGRRTFIRAREIQRYIDRLENSAQPRAHRTED